MKHTPSNVHAKPGPKSVELLPFPLMSEFLTYLEAILGRQPLTVREYRYDLTLFFRYVICLRRHLPLTALEEQKIEQIDLEFLREVSLNECYAFLAWLSQARGAGPSNRARKVAALRAFFKYLHSKRKLLDQNPCQDLESPKQMKRLPKFLNLDESQALLSEVQQGEGQFKERDHCILTLFLNCGLRLSELSSLRLDDLREDTLRVVGKGNKERTVYLNGACLAAIQAYLDCRPKRLPEKVSPYLFISRQGTVLSNAAIQRMVKKELQRAGLDSTRYSTHKLRHTAATLMYQYGRVDIRLLQQLLGHSSISTTEIYTHVNTDQLHEAVEKNPLAQLRPKG